MITPTASRWRPLAVLGALCLVLAACVGPVGTHRSDPKTVLRDLARGATTTGEQTWQTRNVLLEQGLFEAFDERPEEVLAALHKTMVATGGRPAHCSAASVGDQDVRRSRRSQ